MRGKRGLLLAVVILLVFGIFAFQGADIETYAKGTTSKWTVATSKKTYAYTGKKIKPKVTVKYKGKKLKPKNYKVTYPKKPVKPGKYKIKVTLKGKYKGKKLKGSKTIEYSIAVPAVKGLSGTIKSGEYYGDALCFSWDDNSAMNIDGYDIEVKNNGKNGNKLTKKKIEAYYSNYNVEIYEYGTTYTFRIRSYKKIGGKKYYSKWSKVTKKVPVPDYHMTTKTVNGIELAYKQDAFPFFKYTGYSSYDGDVKDRTSKNFAQCYFPIFIKQRLKDNFIIHTEYNEKCGFSSFSHSQYIPNRKDVQVATNISVTYYNEMPFEDKMQQALYKQGYVGYILVNASCLLDKKQSVGVYFGDAKVVTLVSNGYSKAKEYDYRKYRGYNPFIEPVYIYESEVLLKDMLKDVAKCAPNMTDYETYTALKYWIQNHTYTEYSCWGAATVANAMMDLGYPYIILSCSYDGKDGLYNDYSRYYSPASKIAHDSAGHMITLIFMEPGKYVRCEVQGYGFGSSEFKFDPTGWQRPVNSTLTSASAEFGLNEYNTIEELMKGDYYIDINKYDPYDWHTWSAHLE